MLNACRVVLGLALLVATLSDSLGQSSKQTSPSAAQSNSQAQAKGNTDQQKAPSDQRGTESAPLVVKIVGTEPQAQRAADTDRNGNKDNSADWSMVGASVAIAIIAVLQLFAFVAQAWWLRQTVAIMKDTAQRQLRAYVSDVEGEAAFSGDGTFINVDIVFRNSGQTPAYDVEIRCDPPVLGRTDARPFDQASRFAPVQTIIAPDSKFVIRRILSIDNDANAIQQIQNSERAIFIWGSVNYRDAFAKRRHFVFRCIALGPGPSWRLVPHPDGYEAD
jgi:hypothetical protein